MAFTSTNVITDVRYALNDTDTAQPKRRWQDAELFGYLNDGAGELRRRRTDAQYDSTGAIWAWTDISALAAAVSLPDWCRSALMHYICWRAFQKPAGETLNENQAKFHKDAFKDALGV